MNAPLDLARTTLLIVDLQNDFLHPEGAYGRAGQSADSIAALPARIAPLAGAIRARGGWVVSAQFTLVPGKGGEPFISPHLKALRPFLGKGDFAPGSWGNSLVDEFSLLCTNRPAIECALEFSFLLAVECKLFLFG